MLTLKEGPKLTGPLLLSLTLCLALLSNHGMFLLSEKFIKENLCFPSFQITASFCNNRRWIFYVIIHKKHLYQAYQSIINQSFC